MKNLKGHHLLIAAVVIGLGVWYYNSQMKPKQVAASATPASTTA